MMWWGCIEDFCSGQSASSQLASYMPRSLRIVLMVLLGSLAVRKYKSRPNVVYLDNYNRTTGQPAKVRRSISASWLKNNLPEIALVVVATAIVGFGLCTSKWDALTTLHHWSAAPNCEASSLCWPCPKSARSARVLQAARCRRRRDRMRAVLWKIAVRQPVKRNLISAPRATACRPASRRDRRWSGP